ncbi:hypothetical protein ATE48_17050 [Candidatus Viadribacter manganicus]|uniref:DUF998 domain-containing protein n=2 Tax=Candidatus Viadribacter manganicus TaxID=1759059 RepID=A0A1B1ALQ9_9PROT|nr:hypothetical protein ATE48_17050 [Candidatus Viadribacter manganicus]
MAGMNGKLAMITGLLGAAWLVAMVLIGGASFDGYDHVAQYISELGANGAPYGWHVSWMGFLPIGVLICAFAYFAWRAAPRSVLATLGFVGVFLFSIGYVGSAFFPCDYGCRPDNPSFSQVMHELVGLAGYLLAPLTLIVLGLAAWKWPGAAWLAVVAFIAAVGALVGLGGIMDAASPQVGLYQRALEASVLGWIVSCSLYLGLKNKTAAQ